MRELRFLTYTLTSPAVLTTGEVIKRLKKI